MANLDEMPKFVYTVIQKKVNSTAGTIKEDQ